jgi:hypothetical protein
LILHPFLLFGCIYWIPMSNFEHPMQLWKVLHRQLYLLKLLQEDCSFSSCAHVLCGMNPTPCVKMPMMPNMLEVKHINKGYYTSCICCTWVWSLPHLDSTFFFTQSKAFFIPFLFYMQVAQIQTFIEVWSCCLRPLWQIDGCPNLPNCI